MEADKRNNEFVRWVHKNYVGYLFMAPFLILLTIFTIVPVIMAILQSFTSYNMLQPAKFVGLLNYQQLFMDDDIFGTAIKNTFLFAFVVGPIGFLMSFFMAWIISRMKYKNIFALAFYAPSITSSIAMSVVWLYIFSGDRYGLLNNLLINWGIISEPILWTMNSSTILGVVMFVAIWMSMGTGFLVFLAGIQSIPKELCEAGRIDGIGNDFQELWYIILPFMKPQCLFAAINSIVGAFSVFDVAVALAGMPSPNYAAHTIVAHLYDYAFIRFEMGYASAVATILFAIIYLFGKIAMKILSSKDM